MLVEACGDIFPSLPPTARRWQKQPPSVGRNHHIHAAPLSLYVIRGWRGSSPLLKNIRGGSVSNTSIDRRPPLWVSGGWYLHLQQDGQRALTRTSPTAVRLHIRFDLSLGKLKLCISRKNRAELSVFNIHNSSTEGFLTQTITRPDASWCDCHLIVKSGQNTLITQAGWAYFSRSQSFPMSSFRNWSGCQWTPHIPNWLNIMQ